MIKLADTLAPMADFPAVEAKDVALRKADGTEKSIQNMYNVGELGGGSSIFYGTQAEWEELTPEEKKTYDYAAFGDDREEFSKKDFYIFISDSYNDGAYDPNPDHKGWISQCAERLNLDSSQWVNCSQSGGSFHAGTWLTKLTEYYQSITNLQAQKVTHIVIGGGINDCLTDGTNNYSTYDTVTAYLSRLGTSIHQVSNYVKTNFPNAKIYFCPIGYAMEYSQVLNGRGIDSRSFCYAWMRQAMSDYGNYVLPTNTEYCLHSREYLYSGDWLHPNNVGTVVIARALSQAIRTGTCDSTYVWHQAKLTNPKINTDNLKIMEKLENDKVVLTMTGYIIPSEQLDLNHNFDLGVCDLVYLQKTTGRSFVKVEASTPTGNIEAMWELRVIPQSDGIHLYLDGGVIAASTWAYENIVLKKNEPSNIRMSAIVEPASLC